MNRLSLIFIVVVSLLGVSCDKSGDKPVEPTPDGAYYQSIGSDEELFIFGDRQLLSMSYYGGEYTGFTSKYSIKDNFLTLTELQNFDSSCEDTERRSRGRLAYQFYYGRLMMTFGHEGDYGAFNKASEEQVQSFVSSFNCDIVTQFMSTLPDL